MRKESRKKPSKSNTSQETKKRVVRGQEFLCNTVYDVGLPPPLSAQPKCFHFPFEKDRLVKQASASVDFASKVPLTLDPLFSVPINLVDPLAYALPEGIVTELHPDDYPLLKPPETNDNKNKIDLSANWLKDTSDRYTRSFFTESFVQRSARESNDASVPSSNPVTKRLDTLQPVQSAYIDGKLVHCRDPSLKPVKIIPLVAKTFNQPIFTYSILERPSKVFIDDSGEIPTVLHNTNGGIGLYAGNADYGTSKELDWKAHYTVVPTGSEKDTGGEFLVIDPSSSSAQYYIISSRDKLKKRTQSALQSDKIKGNDTDITPAPKRLRIASKFE